jgi:hypothetical protein
MCSPESQKPEGAPDDVHGTDAASPPRVLQGVLTEQPRAKSCRGGGEHLDDFGGPVLEHVLQQQQRLVHVAPELASVLQAPGDDAHDLLVALCVVCSL